MKRLIERYIPVREISVGVRREKFTSQKTDVVMHVYWARRPHINSRVFSFASSVPDTHRNASIAKALAKPDWELPLPTVAAAKKVIGPGRRMLDPFSGAGTHPLEAARLGFEAWGLDYNPVAVVLGKAVMEFPRPGMASKVRKIAGEVYSKVKREIGENYDNDVHTYIWCRYIDCDCGFHLPLTNIKKIGKNVYVDQRKDGILEISERPGMYETEYKGGNIVCPKCGKKWHFDEENITDRIICEITEDGHVRKPDAETVLVDVPDFEKTPNTNDTFVNRYKYWEDCFNDRQLAANFSFVRAIREITDDPALRTYLSMIFGRMIDYNSRFVTYSRKKNGLGHTFTVLNPGFKGMYAEVNPLTKGASGWIAATEYVISAIETNSFEKNAHSIYGTATDLPFEDDYFDLVFTDPPYYDFVDYAETSGFFYAWQRRILGDIFPDLFANGSIDKTYEAVHNPGRDCDYAGLMKKAFAEIRRVLKPGSPFVLVYSHTKEEGWKPIYDAVESAGFDVVKEWEVLTEKPVRVNPTKTYTSKYIYML